METLRGGILDFQSVYGFFQFFLPDAMDWLAFALAGGLVAFIVINVMVIGTGLYTWFERRVKDDI